MTTREKILNSFNDYCYKHNGKEPDALLCSIRFYEDDVDAEVCIKLNCEYEDHDDDNFFFYCGHINDFLYLLGESSNCEDFYVKEVYEFIDSKEYFS